MPKTHSRKTKRFVVNVKPHPFWRRLLPFVPYFVGQRVSLKIEVEAISQEKISYWLDILESFDGNDKLYDRLHKLENNVFEGDVISNEGDIVYKLDITGPRGFLNETLTIFTARAINTDRWSLGRVGFVIGIMGTVIAQTIANLIKTDPAWHVWMPEWVLQWLR